MKSYVLGIMFASLVGLGLTAGCSSSTSPGASAPTCSAYGASTCTGGNALQACVTKNADGSCASLYYTVGTQTFNCNSCTDATTCASNAVNACIGTTGGNDGGTVVDSGGNTVDSGNTEVDSGNEIVDSGGAG